MSLSTEDISPEELVSHLGQFYGLQAAASALGVTVTNLRYLCEKNGLGSAQKYVKPKAGSTANKSLPWPKRNDASTHHKRYHKYFCLRGRDFNGKPYPYD